MKRRSTDLFVSRTTLLLLFGVLLCVFTQTVNVGIFLSGMLTYRLSDSFINDKQK